MSLYALCTRPWWCRRFHRRRWQRELRWISPPLARVERGRSVWHCTLCGRDRP